MHHQDEICAEGARARLGIGVGPRKGLGVEKKLYKHKNFFLSIKMHLLLTYFLGSTPIRDVLCDALASTLYPGRNGRRKEGRQEGRREGRMQGRKDCSSCFISFQQFS